VAQCTILCMECFAFAIRSFPLPILIINRLGKILDIHELTNIPCLSSC
jgi:hypothetical protein